MGIRDQAGEWGPGPCAPESPVPPAAAAGHFPGPPACDGAKTAPSDAAPPATQRETSSCYKNTHQYRPYDIHFTHATSSCVLIHTMETQLVWLWGV